MASEHRSRPLEAELRVDALDVLGDAVQWRLTSQRWYVVRGVLDVMRSAVDVGDVEALRAAVFELELAGPVRAVPTDGPEVVEPPDLVRDLINELVHDLSGEEAPETAVDQRQS